MSNALVIGCGRKFAQSITDNLSSLDYSIYGISSKNFDNSNYLQVDWETCSIFHFEKFIKSLPKLDIILFNQNFPTLDVSSTCLGNQTLDIPFKQSKKWMQAHYVNCILPYHILHSLSTNDKLLEQTTICWMLSGSALRLRTSVDYSGQKYQNYIMMKQMAANNSQTCVGFCPSHLDGDSIDTQASALVKLLTNIQETQSSKIFKTNSDNECVEMTMNI
jgi:hypothetical protein